MKKYFTLLPIFLILIVLVGLGLYFGLTSQEFTCSGTILEISDISKVYSDGLSKEAIRVTYSTVPTGECLRIRVSESDFESWLSGFDANKDILGDISLTANYKMFNVEQHQERKVFKIGTQNRGFDLTCTVSECADPNAFSAFSPGGTTDCYCFSDSHIGYDAEFLSSTELGWETDITIGTDSERFTNDKMSGKVGNNVYVKWAGNLVSNIGLDRPDKDAFFPFSDNKYRMVNDGAYDKLNINYQNVRDNLIQCNTFEGCNSGYVGKELQNTNAYNSLVNTETTNKLSSWILAEPYVKDAYFLGNQLEADLGGNPIVYPQFVLDIDADYVGVFISEGKPKVICPTDFSFNSGDRKEATLTLQNIANTAGTFGYSVSCSDGSVTLTPTPPKSLGASGSLSIKGVHTMSVEEGTKKATCTFTATESNSGEQASCSYSMSATHVSQCIEGAKSCELGNRELWICQKDGSFQKIPCKFGCEEINNIAQCKGESKEICNDKIDNDGDGLIDLKDPDCEDFDECAPKLSIFGITIIPNTDLSCLFGNTFGIIRLIVSILGALISGLIAYDMLRKTIFKKKSELTANIVFSIIIGIGIGLMILYLFVIGIVVAILLILARGLVGMFLRR